MLTLLTLFAALAAFVSSPIRLLERSQAMTVRQQAGHAPAPSVTTWVFDEHDKRNGDPQTTVFLRVNGKRVLVLRNVTAHFDIMDRPEYRERNVPLKAIAACKGWWAGQGEELYALRSTKRVTVFIRYLDEESPTPAYKRLKSISIH